MESKIRAVTVSSAGIKLDSFLKLSGEVVSGGQAKILILAGGVALNGEICMMRGRKLKDGDVVEVRGNRYVVDVEEEKF